MQAGLGVDRRTLEMLDQQQQQPGNATSQLLSFKNLNFEVYLEQHLQHLHTGSLIRSFLPGLKSFKVNGV